MSKAIIVSDEVYELLKNGSMIEQEWNEIEVKRPYFHLNNYSLKYNLCKTTTLTL